MKSLMNINAVELLPEIKSLYDTGCVNPTLVGDYAHVEQHIGDRDKDGGPIRLMTVDIFKAYEVIERRHCDWAEE